MKWSLKGGFRDYFKFFKNCFLLSMLSTFEFWQYLNTRCKGKTLLGLSTNYLFSVQYKADTKQNMVFSVAKGEKIQISLHYQTSTRFHQGLFKSFRLSYKNFTAATTNGVKQTTVMHYVHVFSNLLKWNILTACLYFLNFRDRWVNKKTKTIWIHLVMHNHIDKYSLKLESAPSLQFKKVACFIKL